MLRPAGRLRHRHDGGLRVAEVAPHRSLRGVEGKVEEAEVGPAAEDGEDAIEGFPEKLKTVVQHILISHHGEYEFGSPKLPMIREALAFHYMDDLDSKMGAVRAALAIDSGEPEWSAYSGALGRKFLRLDKFLKPAPTRDTNPK